MIIEVNIWSVGAPYVGAHRLNRGLITTKGKVIGFTTDRLVCLDQATGKEHWSTLIALSRRVDSMAGSQSHVYLSLRRTAKTPAELRAYRLDNGKLDWQQTVEASGSVSIASGLVLVASEGQIRAYGPAERTFKLAIDSKVPADYRPIKYHEEPDEGDTDEERARRSLDPTRAIEPETEERPEQASARANAMGEMAILRFKWGRPVSDMVREIRERQRLLPGVPLVLSIDWLDAKRAALLSPSRGKWWTPAELESFAIACSQLTHAARPEYIDIAPELNVYLARYPELSDPALAFVQQVGHAVKTANPSTRVIASFNAELLLDRYGKTDYLPFGAVPRPRPWKLSRLEPILLAMDSIGITLRPQTGFVFPVDIPSNYLFPLREWFGKKPLLITAIDVKADIDVKKNGGDKQRDFLEQSLKSCYWMETRLIAVRLDGEGAEDEAFALRSAKTERPALEAWRHVNSWRLVNFLTSELALAKREATPQFPD